MFADVKKKRKLDVRLVDGCEESKPNPCTLVGCLPNDLPTLYLLLVTNRYNAPSYLELILTSATNQDLFSLIQ